MPKTDGRIEKTVRRIEKMINIVKYKKQLQNCKNMKEVKEFIKRYKDKNETYMDWLTRECRLDHDNRQIYLNATSAN